MDQGLFHFVMIKPSRYDDDGYPLQWIRSAIPSNTLACVYALADDARRRAVLGTQVEIRLHAYDETNRRIRPERIIRTIRKSGGRALIGFIGVQSNQFPRSVDLARRFVAVTDDNLARNRDWELLFDCLIHLRKTEFPDLVFTIQVDTLCHKIPNFIEKATQAGARHVFVGLENINPDNLIAAKKRQNKIAEYRELLQKWRDHGAITHAGYILGFPADTKETIIRDIEIIKPELPLDILEFFFLTPLPGSEDHKVLWQKGVWMDPDMNKYDTSHRVSHHCKMSDEEWEDAYRAAWATYYRSDHIRTIIRRAAACKLGRPEATMLTLLFVSRTIPLEGVHPLEGGIIRLKFRRDRRPGMKIENPLAFYPRYAWETVSKLFAYLRLYRELKAILDESVAAPDRWTYTNAAIAPQQPDEFERLSLYHDTTGGEAALARKRREDAIRVTGRTRNSRPFLTTAHGTPREMH
jgi:hypothetical protein